MMTAGNRTSIGAFVAGAAMALVGVAVMTTAWSAGAAPSAPDGTETTFVPIEPCRLADTRPGDNRIGSIGTLGSASTSTFTAVGASGQCDDVPEGAASVSLNVTGLNATEQTFLTFWAEGEQPTVASLNPSPGEPPTPNAVVVGLTAQGSFNVYNDVGTVDIVMDVNGYFTNDGLEVINNRLGSLPISPLNPSTGRIICGGPDWYFAWGCLEASDPAQANFASELGFALDSSAYPPGTEFRLKVVVSAEGGEPTTSCYRLWDGEAKAPVPGSEVCVDASEQLGTDSLGGVGLLGGVGTSELFAVPEGSRSYAIEARQTSPSPGSKFGAVTSIQGALLLVEG